MPRVCTVCTHNDREAIDQAIVTGAQSKAAIARDAGLRVDAIRNHGNKHLPATLAKAAEAAEIVRADDLLGQCRNMNAVSRAVLTEERENGDNKIALTAVDRVLKCLELEGRLLGELNDQTIINIWLNPEWVRVKVLLLDALQPFPEAKTAVARALSGVGG